MQDFSLLYLQSDMIGKKFDRLEMKSIGANSEEGKIWKWMAEKRNAQNVRIQCSAKNHFEYSSMHMFKHIKQAQWIHTTTLNMLPIFTWFQFVYNSLYDYK